MAKADEAKKTPKTTAKKVTEKPASQPVQETSAEENSQVPTAETAGSSPEETAAPESSPTTESSAAELSFEDMIRAFRGESIILTEGGAGVLDAIAGFLDAPTDECCAEAASCCGADSEEETAYSLGIAEGLRRAQHPVFGIGIQPVAAPQSVQIVERDETTRSFGHLADLKKLYDAGILTDAEYEGKKADILKRIY